MPGVERFQVAVQHLDGAAAVRLVGELDSAVADQLEAGFRPLLHRYDAAQLVLDCGELAAVDDDALVLLLRILDRFGPSGRPALRSPSPALRELLLATGAAERFELSS